MEELPMILFTVIAQMAIGAFWALGFVQLLGRLRKLPGESIDRVTDTSLFAVGPLLVLGFFAAFFHLNDPFHAPFTLLHVGSSWLSRELLSGVLFGGFGFVFAACQWNKWLTRTLRDALAVLTALSGLALLAAMSGVYCTVKTIPAWHTPAIPVFFFASALLTGPLAVALSLLLVWKKALSATDTVSAPESWKDWRQHLAVGQISDDLKSLVHSAMQILTIVSAASGIIIMITYPAYLLGLHQQGGAAAHVADVISGGFLTCRLILLGIAVVGAGVFAFTQIRLHSQPTTTLTVLLCGSLLLAFISELLGRAVHYEGLWHVGLNTVQHVIAP
ncbi:dimethyl sulfoxide reductase anchor subunit family protein [Mobiluncus curtisii]|uniref:Dimethyl sulfoxide reductase anchor subunit n=1 Tax=Mobiluncus curtisii TaxID=2051 RepID=A0A7Y0UGX0_9ACTO|nr:DmsC/YnfH family molybdoenzyme membrane anchor subunit [Mobiluncus curtisii]MCU9986370.1 DMSO reductase [Mobiluncus curtisii]MCV0000097.1 DMSO reductase [Mobiluncus curtisii]NMW48668.1 dimethyl sulfoxide reductase anchor subunit [Mobiluncus curtisii]NMW87105.1 dimethyl sulfoxide reductase anchor subunit [Mobiluncus curtisii]NMW88780.1 dimethyl sulfoxide reductase anchor subunit [Mobiluncus curtisii]